MHLLLAQLPCPIAESLWAIGENRGTSLCKFCCKLGMNDRHLSSQLSDSMSAMENVAFLGKLRPSSARRKLETFSIFCTIFVMLVLLFSLLGSLTCTRQSLDINKRSVSSKPCLSQEPLLSDTEPCTLSYFGFSIMSTSLAEATKTL